MALKTKPFQDMKTTKSKYSGEFKAKVALEAIAQKKTMSEIASTYSVHPTQIIKWKKELQANMGEIFSDKRKKVDDSKEKLVDELYKQIGQLKVENDWLKKKSEMF